MGNDRGAGSEGSWGWLCHGCPSPTPSSQAPGPSSSCNSPLLLPLREGPWPQGREAEGGDNALSPSSNDRAEGTVWSLQPEGIGQRWLAATARLKSFLYHLPQEKRL